MKTSVIAASLLGGLVLVASSLQAQNVSADVVLRSGPVAGHVVVGDGYSTYRRRQVVHYRAAPRVIVIERVHRHRSARYWERNGFRPVTVYYVNGRYYDRWYGNPRAAARTVVYERGGRYYESCDYHGRDHRHGHDRHHDWDD
jgi:hypothetical protein